MYTTRDYATLYGGRLTKETGHMVYVIKQSNETYVRVNKPPTRRECVTSGSFSRELDAPGAPGAAAGRVGCVLSLSHAGLWTAAVRSAQCMLVAPEALVGRRPLLTGAPCASRVRWRGRKHAPMEPWFAPTNVDDIGSI